MGAIEGRYVRTEHSDDDDDNEEREERTEERVDHSEWFDWTGNIVFLADKLNRDVDKITDMTYVSFLFWSNYFKLKHEEEYRNK